MGLILDCLNKDFSGDALTKTLNRYAAMKKKFFRANGVPYMPKALRKAIIKRSGLKSKYNKNRRQSNINFKKQKNFCSKLYKEGKKANLFLN